MERPPFIKNLSELVFESHYLDEPVEKYRCRKRLGKAVQTEKLGINLSLLKPGQVSSRYHSHSVEEEFLIILEGRAELRVGEDRFVVEKDDFVSLRPNGEPHQLVNEFEKDCRYLEIGTRDPQDQIFYPEE